MESDISEVGFKFHMNDINATIGLTNLPFVHEILQRCRDNASFYQNTLSQLKGIAIVYGAHSGLSSYWLFSLRVLNGKKPALMSFLNDRGVVVSQVHKRNDTHSCMASFRISLPNLDVLERELVCIPVGWWVSDTDRAQICQFIKEFTSRETRSKL